MRKAGLAVAAVAVVGAGVAGGTALASATDDGGAARHGYGPGYGAGPGAPGERPWALGGPFDGEAVSGDALAKVTAAVTAYDAALSVEHVVEQEDGTYLVLATGSDEERTALTVSADFATVTEAPFGGPGGHGGPGSPGGPGGPGDHGPMGGAEVTGAELTKLTAAVTAYDSALTVEHAFQRDGEGDYFVLATGGADEPTALRVSADLKTVEKVDGPRGPADGERPPSPPAV